MKVIIIAGGLGTRISEETEDKPKPWESIASLAAWTTRGWEDNPR